MTMYAIAPKIVSSDQYGCMVASVQRITVVIILSVMDRISNEVLES